MNILIIVILYVISVFVNREMNRIGLKHGAEKLWGLWFIPILPAFVLLIGIIWDKKLFDNWFTGKHW